jgi:hypothetical protein
MHGSLRRIAGTCGSGSEGLCQTAAVGTSSHREERLGKERTRAELTGTNIAHLSRRPLVNLTVAERGCV